MRATVADNHDLYEVVVAALKECKPADGCWLCRADDTGFVDTSKDAMELQRLVLELACVEPFVPPYLTEINIDAISHFCDGLPADSPVHMAAYRLKESLYTFLPWIRRKALLTSIRNGLKLRVPHETLIFARTTSEAHLAQLMTGCFVTHLATPRDASALLNSRWALVVGVNYKPDEVCNEFALATVAAQKWICWNTAGPTDDICDLNETGNK